MSASPSVIVFDVNETLSDMSPMAQRFSDVGAPAHLAKLWFASLLRDGFALTAAGTSRLLAELGTDVASDIVIPRPGGRAHATAPRIGSHPMGHVHPVGAGQRNAAQPLAGGDMND